MYGILLIMILYNLFHLIILKDSLFLFYMFSIIGFMFHFFTKDGLGFQYVWFNHPEVQDQVYNFSVCFAMVNQLLFTWKFFEKQLENSWYKNILWVLIVARMAYLIYVITVKSDSNLFLMADLPLILFMCFISILNIQISEIRTFFFPMGSILFLTGYVFTTLFELGVVHFDHSLWVVYAYNFGLLAQIIAFWGCISFRERNLLIAKESMDFELKIKNTELKLLEMHQVELENAVNAATKSLEKKNAIIKTTSKNLETFVYKTYHNLRGPLRTIMGLYNLSKTTKDPELIKELFFHFNKSITDVDKELLVISKVADINIHEIKLENVDLYGIVQKTFGEVPIQLDPEDPSHFNTEGDIWLLEEGIIHIKEIYEKLKTDKISPPELSLRIENDAFVFTILFKSATMKDFDVNNFFTPFNKNMSYFYNLHFEPFLCQAIMDKIKGKIQMQKMGDDKIMITVSSK
ncbi:MAG: 7TM-DISM domain-containing protein, partial [Cytophagales bacterium]|nr:7TM-DISM domain-containing protein [Cytophagales bacterium]